MNVVSAIVADERLNWFKEQLTRRELGEITNLSVWRTDVWIGDVSVEAYMQLLDTPEKRKVWRKPSSDYAAVPIPASATEALAALRAKDYLANVARFIRSLQEVDSQA